MTFAAPLCMFVLFAALAAPVAIGRQKTGVDGAGLGESRGTS